MNINIKQKQNNKTMIPNLHFFTITNNDKHNYI